MKNTIDAQYQELLRKILTVGHRKGDRTGTGTRSLFGQQIRHDMREGFPLLTTKKMYFRGIVAELVWFLRGETNIRWLVQNGCNIWNGDAYKNYVKHCSANSLEWNEWMKDNGDGSLSMYTLQEFVEKIRDDEKFAERWGELGPIYGKQWRMWGEGGEYVDEHVDGNGITFAAVLDSRKDQVGDMLKKLRTNPDDRRMIVTAWNPDEIDQAVLPPCHIGFQVWTRLLHVGERVDLVKDPKFDLLELGISNGTDEDHEREIHAILDTYGVPRRAISLIWWQRSVDTFLGLPFNIASYALLLMAIAQEVNMVPEELIGNLGDTHLYENHLEAAIELCSREPMGLPQVKLAPWTVRSDGHSLWNLRIEDFELQNYSSHSTIKAELNN